MRRLTCLALAMLWNALGQPVLGGAAVMLLLWPVQVEGLVMQQSILMIRHAQRHQSALISAFEQGLSRFVLA